MSSDDKMVNQLTQAEQSENPNEHLNTNFELIDSKIKENEFKNEIRLECIENDVSAKKVILFNIIKYCFKIFFYIFII